VADRLHGQGVEEGDFRGSRERLVGEVGDLHGEDQAVAFAQKAGRIGENHQFAAGYRSVFQGAGLEVAGMGQGHHPPAGERFGHFKAKDHIAGSIGGQLGKKEGRLVEILSGFGRGNGRRNPGAASCGTSGNPGNSRFWGRGFLHAEENLVPGTFGLYLGNHR